MNLNIWRIPQLHCYYIILDSMYAVPNNSLHTIEIQYYWIWGRKLWKHCLKKQTQVVSIVSFSHNVFHAFKDIKSFVPYSMCQLYSYWI